MLVTSWTVLILRGQMWNEECFLRSWQLVIRTSWQKELFARVNFSHYNLIYFFRQQLKIKIKCVRKGLNRITFDERRVKAARLVVRKGTTLDSSFSSLPVYGWNGLGPPVGLYLKCAKFRSFYALVCSVIGPVTEIQDSRVSSFFRHF